MNRAKGKARPVEFHRSERNPSPQLVGWAVFEEPVSSRAEGSANRPEEGSEAAGGVL